MAKKHEISAEEVLKIKGLQKKNRDKTVDKWLEVLLLRAVGKTRAQISEKTGFSEGYISDLMKEYGEVGLEEFAKKQYKGNNRNLSFAEEVALLAPFKAKAKSGQIVEVSEILAAYEAKIGREIKSSSHIYYVLKRHGWRKLMPRSKHPNKASDEEIEASKKLTQR